MKIKIIALLVTLALVGAVVWYSQSLTPNPLQPMPKEPVVGKDLAPFPTIVFRTPDGKAIQVQDLKEPVVLVHFWAAWCAPCQAEFPELLAYVASTHGKVALLSVSLDDRYEDSQKTLDAVAAKNNLKLNAPHIYWAWDEGKQLSLHSFNTVKVPETIIVDHARRMVDKIIGPGPWAETAKK
jgi:thiol-disulfide isomerase/thioredoxin